MLDRHDVVHGARHPDGIVESQSSHGVLEGQLVRHHGDLKEQGKDGAPGENSQSGRDELHVAPVRTQKNGVISLEVIDENTGEYRAEGRHHADDEIVARHGDGTVVRRGVDAKQRHLPHVNGVGQRAEHELPDHQDKNRLRHSERAFHEGQGKADALVGVNEKPVEVDKRLYDDQEYHVVPGGKPVYDVAADPAEGHDAKDVRAGDEGYDMVAYAVFLADENVREGREDGVQKVPGAVGEGEVEEVFALERHHRPFKHAPVAVGMLRRHFGRLGLVENVDHAEDAGNKEDHHEAEERQILPHSRQDIKGVA